MYQITAFKFRKIRNYLKFGDILRFTAAALFMFFLSGVQAQNKGFSQINCDGTENGIVNGSFETGDFSGWIVTDLSEPFFPLMVMGSGVQTWLGFFMSTPTDGTFEAFTGFDGNGPGIISLAQDVSITPCTSLLTFDYRAAWELSMFGATIDRHFRVEVQPDGGGTALQSWMVLTAKAGTLVDDTGNLSEAIDLSAYLNQNIRIVFAWEIPEDFSGPAQFQLDNVHLRAPVIHASSGENGTISPAGDIAVASGGTRKFDFTPDEGHAVKDVIVDGSHLGYLADFRFSNVVSDHSIRVTFFSLTAQSQPPVITAFTAIPEAGNAPLNVVFSATAEDPDGGGIIQYRWDFDGDGIFDTATTEGTVSHRYVVPGDYPVTVMVVDDQWEATVSNPLLVQVSKPAVMEIPLPTVLDVSKSFGSVKGELSIVSNFVVNPFGEPVTVSLVATDADGEVLATLNQVLPAYGKQLVDLSGFAEVAYTRVKLQADHYVILATDMAVSNSRMWAHLPTSLASSLLIPHIAGTSGWQTLAFLSNSPRYNLDMVIGGQSHPLGNAYLPFIDLGAMLPENENEGKAWGKAIDNPGNPFSDNQVLSGFQVFFQTDGDGAAMELPGTAAETLYLAATNFNTADGWKGLALTNPGSQPVTAVFSFYKTDGSPAGSGTLTIPAGEKLAGAFAQLFPDLDSDAKWARVDADGPLAGLQLLGGSGGGIAGLTLNRCPDTKLTIPLVAANMVASVSVTNPAEMAADVVLSLTGSDGVVKGTNQFLLNSGSASTSKIADLFPDVELTDSDYLMLKASCGVLATVTATNEAGTTWMGLAAVR
ncbi:MAG: PKD domain-containing protein [Acidobacteria bacterium]|nr:PKD domain-containing protein [Acidobacteriota bacterium]